MQRMCGNCWYAKYWLEDYMEVRDYIMCYHPHIAQVNKASYGSKIVIKRGACRLWMQGEDLTVDTSNVFPDYGGF